MLKAAAICAVAALTGLLGQGLTGQQPRAEESKTTIWMGPAPDVAKGALLIDQGQVARGIAVTKQAMQNNLHINDLAVAYNNLCTGDLALRLYHRALAHCNRALRLRPKMWQSYNNRANAYFGLGQWDRAIKDYKRAVNLSPDQDIIAFNLYLAMERKRLGGKPLVSEQDG